MKTLSLWTPLALGASVCGLALFVACSSSSSNGPGDGSSSPDGSVSPTSCASNTLNVLFAPMYSAFDGTHTFQIPAVVDGIKSQVTWSSSDPSMVALAPDPTTGGVMITTQKPGTVTIVATAGTLCGSSVLTITQASAEDWNAGNERYNNGNVIRLGPREAGADAGSAKEAACTNCHGDNASGPFKDVAHTPEQTGGFSDDQLVAIFTTGAVPDGGYFDESIVPYQIWKRFHQWDMTADEAKGVVVYLRSLTPEDQNGSSNFGGRRDGGGGGPRDGGGPPKGDGGAPPPDTDASGDDASADDASSATD
jgi:hypothetical protein